jgi:thiosulfate/3-mercaptopyruvate sulfurtransferase
VGTVVRYGRAGHIPSSVNVPTVSLIDPVTHAYLPAEQLRAKFEAVGALSRERVITYCGGGIAASSDAVATVPLMPSSLRSLQSWRSMGGNFAAPRTPQA